MVVEFVIVVKVCKVHIEKLIPNDFTVYQFI